MALTPTLSRQTGRGRRRRGYRDTPSVTFSFTGPGGRHVDRVAGAEAAEGQVEIVGPGILRLLNSMRR
jgi:hypothetical protein